MGAATNQDLFDHIMGSGFECYEQYRRVWWDFDFDDVPSNWTAEIEIENGDGGVTEAYLDASRLRQAVRDIAADKCNVGESYRERISTLLKDVDDADIDAYDADIIIQVAILGEVIFG